METTPSRLHPLLTAAAISVTVFSAVGVGALTGLIPQSFGSHGEVVEQEAIEQPKPAGEIPKAVEPAITHPVVVKPARKPVVRVSKPRPVEPVAYNDFPAAPRLEQAPVMQTPKPVVQPGNIGTIQAVREVAQPGEHTALGPIAGGVAGAVLGNQFGHGNGKKIMTVLGAAGGAFAGREIEKQARGTKRWEIDVRHDSGTQETVLSDVAPAFVAGDRVRVVHGRLQPV